MSSPLKKKKHINIAENFGISFLVVVYSQKKEKKIQIHWQIIRELNQCK